jgi:leucyl aminopeptidase (aminopeptidase T)
MDAAIENIFRVNLGVKRGESVLVFSDLIRPDEPVSKTEKERREGAREVARRAAEIGKLFSEVLYIEFPATGSHGEEPPEVLWQAGFGVKAVEALKREGLLGRLLTKEALKEELRIAQSIVRENKKDAASCVVALSNYSTTHTRFRELLTGSALARYASMPVFDPAMLAGVMLADWKEIKTITLDVAQKMEGAERVHISAPNRTEISFSIKGRPVVADTGILTEPGSFGNLPAGEAFVAPCEGSAKGRLVLEWAPTRKLLCPVTLEVEKGTVVNVSGNEEFAVRLKEKLSLNPLCGNIAELGVGTNAWARRPDNILESEKILGAIHIALGDNSTFGGATRVPFHQDFVVFSPTVEIEKGGKKISVIKEGSFKWQG